MKKTVLLLSAMLMSVFAIGQKRVLLQNGGSSSVYNTINAAYSAAVAGDTIYISGGKFNESISIDKPSIVILGVGYLADSAIATGITEIQGNVTLGANADNGKLQGVYITGYIRVYDVDHYEISRNMVDGEISIRYASFANSLLIEENVLKIGVTSYVGALHNIILQKNIIYGSIQYFDEYCVINNNVILRASIGGCLQYYSNVLVENNVFYYTYDNNIIYGSSTNTNFFSNNILVTNTNFQTTGYGNAVFTNNKYVAPADINKVFVNYDETLVYNPSNDFHLNPDSASVWLGTDGTPIGLYGTQDAALTPTPYKESTLPFNPHISEKSIAKYTDANGKLQVHLKANSQQK